MWPTLSLEASSLNVTSFCLIRRFPRIISSTCSWLDSSVAVTGLPDHALPYKHSSPTCSCLNCHTQRVTVLTWTHLSPYPAWTLQWMWIGGIFFSVNKSVNARYLNRTSSQTSISTGTETQLRIAVGSRLRTVRGRYPLSAWNRFYPLFFIRIKIMTGKAKLFQPVRIYGGNWIRGCRRDSWSICQDRVYWQTWRILLASVTHCTGKRDALYFLNDGKFLHDLHDY
jgi:hypothetical protein